MGFVLLQWLIISIVFTGLGLLFLNFCRIFNSSIRFEGLFELNIAGLAMTAFAAQWISIWSPLNEHVLTGLLGVAILALVIFRRNLVEFILSLKKPAFPQLFLLLSGCMVLTALLKSIGPSEIADEVGYHLPLIRWIEQFGAVPGIANIEDRMGFNSSFHSLCAAFSLPSLWPGGLYDLNGYLYLIFGMYFLTNAMELLRKENNAIQPSNLICAAALVFPFRAYLTSTDADFLNIFLGIYFLVQLLRLTEHKKEIGGFNFLNSGIILGLLISVKASSALLLIYFLDIAWLQSKRIQKISLILVGALIMLLPWLVRNVILSGYLVYPIYYFDFFNVDWKVPLALIKGQYDYIGDYARTMITQPFNTYHKLSPAFWVWFPDWLGYQYSFLIGKTFLFGLGLGIPLCLVFYKKIKLHSASLYKIFLPLLAILILWFLKFPAPRIGWAWILTLIVLIAYLLLKTHSNKAIKYLAVSIFALAVTGIARATLSSVRDDLQAETNWIYPNQVEMPPIVETIQFDSISANVAQYNFCGGNPLPCVPNKYHPGLQARGKTLADGFRIQVKAQ